MTTPNRPTKPLQCFKARCTMGARGSIPSEGVLWVDVPKQRTRFEAFGGWSVTRFDLGLSASQYIPSNPPELALQEEPMLSFTPPRGARFLREDTIDGKECQVWRYTLPSAVHSATVDLWVSVTDDTATPMLLHVKKSLTQTTEIRLLGVETLDSTSDDQFAIESFIPSDRPPVVRVRGTVRFGKVPALATVTATHVDGKKAEWSTRTNVQTNDQGVYELLLTRDPEWKVSIQSSKAKAVHTFTVVPGRSGLVGGAADAQLELIDGATAEVPNASVLSPAAMQDDEEGDAQPVTEREKAVAVEAATRWASSDAEARPSASSNEAGIHDRRTVLRWRVQSKTLACWAEKYSVGNASSLFANWKRRWFTQRGTTIEYREQETSRPLGELELNAETRVTMDVTPAHHSEATKPDRDIVIEWYDKGKQRKLLLRFDTAAEKAEWGQHLADLQELLY